MRYVYTILFTLVFFALLGLAVKNAESVTIHYYLGLEWTAPLVLVLLSSFAIGLGLGILIFLGVIFRQRLEIGRLKQASSTIKTNLGTDSPSAS